MGGSWLEWLLGSICFPWRWPREFWSGIMDGHKQWQVGQWPQFLQPQLVERDEKVAAK